MIFGGSADTAFYTDLEHPFGSNVAVCRTTVPQRLDDDAVNSLRSRWRFGARRTTIHGP